MYDWLIDAINHVIRNGWSTAALLGAVFSLLKIRRIRKQIQRHLPSVFQDRDDERLDLIIKQNNEILRRLGGDPWPTSANAKQSERSTKFSANIKKSFSTSYWAAFTTARFIKSIINYQRNGVNYKMKWFRPEFLTFVVGVIVMFLNELFGWGLTAEGVITFFVTVGGYFVQQGIVNVKRGDDAAFAGISLNSRKLIFTVVGALMIGLNEAIQLGFSSEMLWTVAGLITGYNALEGARDAKKAEPPQPQPTEVYFPRPIAFGFHDEKADEQSH